MRHFGWLVLLLAAFSAPVNAQEKSAGHIKITVHYRSMFPGHIQVRDEVCKAPRDIECEKARIKATGAGCQEEPSREKCQEAKALLDSTLCVEGLVHEGRMTQGEEVEVEVCKSFAGYGSVSVRNTEAGRTWTNYPLRVNDSRISYP